MARQQESGKRDANEVDNTQSAMVEAKAGDKALLGSLATGLLSIVSLQLVSRVLTFALNIAIARSVDRKAFGVGSVQLQLVCDAVLALSREGFRDACQRTHATAWQDASSRARMLANVHCSSTRVWSYELRTMS